MTTERWRQINQLFEAALEQPAAARAEFLAQACADDEELRRRVEASLAADAQNDLLIDRPAHETAAALLVTEAVSAPTEQMVGSYRLLRQIGHGGMGVVYLEQDTRLGRQVALKLLPDYLTGDAERVRRFQREARTASALNHPNIVTIYDFGQEAGRHYIASEFVQGQTLRQLIGSPQRSITQALDLAMQIAGALAAAHEAGIIHRDIKPENLMLRPDGYVKVLDFGLAKLTEHNSSDALRNDADTNATAGSYFETRTGVVLGTDLYRVSVLGGHSRKLSSQVKSLRATGIFSPDGQRMVSSSYSQLLITKLDGTDEQVFAQAPPDKSFWGYSWSLDGKRIAYVVREAGFMNSEYSSVVVKPATGGNEEVILSRRRQQIDDIAWLPGGRGLLVLASGETSGGFQLWELAYPSGKFRPITRDLSDYPSLSLTADGRQILLVRQERSSSLWVATRGEIHATRQVTPGTSHYESVAWTPDGALIYSQGPRGRNGIWRLTLDGAQPQLLLKDGFSNQFPAAAPDGRHFVFVSDRARGANIWRADERGENLQQLSTEGGSFPVVSPDNQWVLYHHLSPEGWGLWKTPLAGGTATRLTDVQAYRPGISPDSQWVACQHLSPETKQRRIAIVPLAGGQPVKFFDNAVNFGRFCWTADGHAITYIAGRTIKLQPIAGGAPQTLLELPGDQLFWFDLSRDGRQIAYNSGHDVSDLVLFAEPK